MLQDIRVRQRDYLLELSRIMTQELDLETLLWEALRISIGLISGEGGFIALYSELNGWDIRVADGLSEEAAAYIDSYLKGINEDMTSQRAETALLQINMMIKRIRSMPQLGIADGVGIPLMIHGKVLGIIVIFRHYKMSFSLDDRVMLKAFADQASIAVNNAYLYSENVKERNWLNAIITSAADGIMVLSVSHNIELANPTALKALHRKQEDIIGKKYEDIIVFEKIERGMTLSDGEAGGWPLNRDSRLYVEGDLTIKNENEKPIPVSITYSPIMTGDNQLVDIIAMIQDISKFREAEDLKNTFISTISHELKTPVAIIKGYASTMTLDDANWDKATVLDSMHVIEDEADRLTSLINNLLDASRLYSGTFKLHKENIDMVDMAKNIARRMQTQTENNQIVCDFPEEFPLIYCDADRLEQVLINFVSNAIKYAPGGKITISGAIKDKNAIISVRDEGPGLRPEDIPHVFERFYRSKISMNKAKGVGLGLYLCQAIIIGHGGKIWAENNPDGKGASFSFSIPLDYDENNDTVTLKGDSF